MFWRSKSYTIASPTAHAYQTLDKTPMIRARSASQLPQMSTTASTMPTSPRMLDAEYLNTLPDPRSPSPAPDPKSPQSPNLSDEVSMLSTKLIHAVNHSTTLDDSLQHARRDLENAQRTIQDLEAQRQSHAQQIADGVFLKKAEVDKTMADLRRSLDEARRERETSERTKKSLELEVETLTASLFEEANKMVADARRQNEGLEKRNLQLRSQLTDAETLMSSQQEQLQDLKTMMEELSSERDETDTFPRPSSVPSSPTSDANKISRMLDSLPTTPGGTPSIELHAENPLHYTHLISPVLRLGLPAYHEFSEFVKISRAMSSVAHQRSSSGHINAAAPPGSAAGGVALNPAASSSSPHLPGSFGGSGGGAAMTSSSSPRSGDASSSSAASSSSLPALKDSKFYKRTLQEDIEPTLRLELAPGLSWLARRAVLTSIVQGALVIEPFSSASKLYGPLYSCTLCGEDRRPEQFARRHRFRTSDDANAQRHPLCEYCVGRVRATCDFAAFLRMCRDGTWKAGSEDEVRGAWEESVRLREKMFWARVGGGVVPAALAVAASQAGGVERARRSAEAESVASSLTEAGGVDKAAAPVAAAAVPAVGANTPPPPTLPAVEDSNAEEDGDVASKAALDSGGAALARGDSEISTDTFEDAASTPEPEGQLGASAGGDVEK